MPKKQKKTKSAIPPSAAKTAVPSAVPHSSLPRGPLVGALRTPYSTRYPDPPAEQINPLEGILLEGPEYGVPASAGSDVPNLAHSQTPTLHHSTLRPIYSAEGIWLYHNNCLAVLDAIAAKHPEGRFDMIFADPPYFLSNGGITCHAGKMVKVDKGAWDKSRGTEWNHEFNTEWLKRCQKVLKPNGTIWVTGTHHVIFSVGFAMQQIGYKILNDIAWEKPNPPPNLSCRYFTHSTETIIWAAKNEKSKHLFNYQEMRKVTGKQMKTVWRMTAPTSGEKTHGKHPTQKPVGLIERCILASTNQGDLVLDPFLGGGTTAVASIRLSRSFLGIEMDPSHADLAARRADRETVLVWLRDFRVRIDVAIFLQNDLDPSGRSMDRIKGMADDTPKADCIFHETKFVFLSCAVVSSASVVHTTVDVSLQEAWAKTPTGKKRETTHVVKCETEIFRVKQSSMEI